MEQQLRECTLKLTKVAMYGVDRIICVFASAPSQVGEPVTVAANKTTRSLEYVLTMVIISSLYM